jgi:hypothetical protein
MKEKPDRQAGPHSSFVCWFDLFKFSWDLVVANSQKAPFSPVSFTSCPLLIFLSNIHCDLLLVVCFYHVTTQCSIAQVTSAPFHLAEFCVLHVSWIHSTEVYQSQKVSTFLVQLCSLFL